MITLKINQWKVTIIVINKLRINLEYKYETIHNRYSMLTSQDNNFFGYLLILKNCNFLEFIWPYSPYDLKIIKLKNIPTDLTLNKARKFSKQPKFFKWFVDNDEYFK